MVRQQAIDPESGLPPPPPFPPPQHVTSTNAAQPTFKTETKSAFQGTTITPITTAPVLVDPMVTVIETGTPVDVHQTPPSFAPVPTNGQIQQSLPTATTPPMTTETAGTSVYIPPTMPQTTQNVQTPYQYIQPTTYQFATNNPTPTTFQPMYQAPTPTFPSQSNTNQSMMSQQMAEFQKQMMDQNQKQMLLLQQQMQSTLESSLKTITDTVAKTLATIPNQVQNQRQPHILQRYVANCPQALKGSQTSNQPCHLSLH